MDFSLTDDQRQLQEMARKFATTELVDLAKELEEKNTPVPSDWMKRYGELGFLGMNIATEYGGMGVGNIEALLVLEEFVKISAAVAFPVFESSVGPVRALEHFATPALKERIIPAVCRGEKIVAVCMSEPAAGSALTDLKTRATKTDGEYIVSGQKRWCSGGGHADGYVVYSRMSDAPGAKGIGAIFVEKGMEGLSFGEPEQLMGFRGVPSADIFFDDVKAPLENEIVPAGGFGKLMEAFDLERCGNATMCLGIAQAAFDYALEYAQEREQFGKAIIDFQAIQIKLADMAMKLEASRLLIHRAAQQANDGLPSVRDSSLAKCFANEISREVCGIALQVMGAYGYSKSYGMEQRLRDSWGWGIAGGTIDIQKVNIAASYAGRRFNQRG
ncbi:acyl-CoA dehydrogenase family protein [Sneathiella marina]|uniref:Acyl-CoA dehydrogenase family protein n=1 Tax=Sneathiella marina TaxID=2950108 RepID=A0ABY4W3Q5_9PROT|nr:acyl-CoA dehydrogenase family protein [Sneathiella marina]USG60758.1 acyl-CoA dehydrogenase family protein [Sneathiella marina]